MNYRVFPFFCLTLFGSLITVVAQNGLDLPYRVELGKRKNVVWGREITEFNLGDKWYNAFYPLYYRIDEGQWERIGPGGRNIRPYIPDTEFSSQHFRAFKRRTKLSYLALSTSMLSFMGWSIASLDYAVTNNDPSYRAFLNPRSLLFLGGFLGGFWLGVEWNARADLDLFMAMRGELTPSEPGSLTIWRLGTATGPFPGLALQCQF
ncbi:MAG: hypothetical protein AAFW73_13985 [Bacteroidota bacterium]